MIVYIEWLCPVCDSKNKTEHPSSDTNEEKFHVVFCSECGNPIVVGLTLYIRAVGYELHEMKLDSIKIVNTEEENYE